MGLSENAVKYALIWKYPTATFTLYMNGNQEPIIETWKCTEHEETPSVPVTVAEYQVTVGMALAKFDTNRLLGVLNTLMSQEAIFRLAAHTANLVGYCTWKNFWGEKSAATYLTLLKDNAVATPEEVILIKQAFMDQHIDLDHPYTAE